MTPDRLPVVLVVEDDQEMASLLEEWLAESYVVRLAHEGEEAMEVIDGEVDIVLLDRRLPRMSGDEVLRRIRERGLDCRVALITAVDIDIDVIEMDFDTYLRKPVSRADVRAAVEQLLTRSMYDDRVRRYLELVSKTEALENGMENKALADNDEYQHLVQQRDDLRAELEYIINSLDDDYFATSILKQMNEESPGAIDL